MEKSSFIIYYTDEERRKSHVIIDDVSDKKEALERFDLQLPDWRQQIKKVVKL